MIGTTAPPQEPSLAAVVEAEILNGHVELPVLPETAARVQAIIQNDGPLSEIADVIEREPAYAAAVLRYANSVAFAGLTPIVDVRKAVSRLGIAAVEQTVLAISAHGAFASNEYVDAQTFRVLWEHSITAALAARRIASRGVSPELAFLAGLLHDMGKVVILRCVASLRQREPERFSFAPSVLDEFFEALHTSVGESFFASWNIPPEIREAVRHHHDSTFDRERPLPAIVACADRIAAKLGASMEPDPKLSILDSPGAELLGLNDVKIAALLVDVEDDVERFNSAT